MITLAASYFPDSEDRIKNYKRFINYWSKFPVKIDIEICKEFTPLMTVYNRLAKRCTTEYIAFIDIDVYFEYEQLEASIAALKNKADFVNPFDKMYNVIDNTAYLQEKHDLHNNMKGNISFSRFVRTIGKNLNEEEKTQFDWNLEINWNTPFFVGLCVVTRLDIYFEFGMGNENFKVWGGADDEWYARAKTLNYKWINLPGSIYHYHHGKSNIKQKKLVRNNIIELYKSISFSKEELMDYISTWPWIITHVSKQ